MICSSGTEAIHWSLCLNLSPKYQQIKLLCGFGMRYESISGMGTSQCHEHIHYYATKNNCFIFEAVQQIKAMYMYTKGIRMFIFSINNKYFAILRE